MASFCEARSNMLIHLLLEMKPQFLFKFVLNCVPPE
jgi:hypothetical protein